MTGPADFSVETPVPDAVDQRREDAPPTDPELEPIEQIPAEANEADVVEQHQVVPVDDEPLGRGDSRG